jgi:hypothetical protein
MFCIICATYRIPLQVLPTLFCIRAMPAMCGTRSTPLPILDEKLRAAVPAHFTNNCTITTA